MDIMDLCIGEQVQDRFPLQGVYLFFDFTIKGKLERRPRNRKRLNTYTAQPKRQKHRKGLTSPEKFLGFFRPMLLNLLRHPKSFACMRKYARITDIEHGTMGVGPVRHSDVP